MTSKVSGKTRLGAVCCVLLIAIALFAGCKQETPESYAPPGYGVSVGPLTDTVWEATNGDTFKFAANGKVSVPDELKILKIQGKLVQVGGKDIVIKYEDFTYTTEPSATGLNVVISGTTNELPNGKESMEFTYLYTESSGESRVITGTAKVGVPRIFKTLTINGIDPNNKQTETTTTENTIGPYKMIDADEVIYSTPLPTTKDVLGNYYDENGRTILQIKDDGTAIFFSKGIQKLKYWKYDNNTDADQGIFEGTIRVADEKNSLNLDYDTYALYPHALISNSSSEIYWK